MKRQLQFGPRLGSVMQVAYVVNDLEKAVQKWSKTLNIGPWLIMENFPAENMLYRGDPTDLDITIALAFSGSMAFELILQNDDSPSVYNEQRVFEDEGLFHHWAIATETFDDDVKRYGEQGFEVAFYGEVVPVGGLRYAYLDTKRSLGGMIELIETGPPFEELFNSIKVASKNWDGKQLFISEQE